MKYISHSIKQRLLNRSRQEKRPFTELLQYYAMERFLYRLSLSPYKKQFILKGALMLQVWESPEQRPTRDIDLLGKINNQKDHILQVIQGILHIHQDDGMMFDMNSISAEDIKEDADYQGVRIKFLAFLDSSRINMQIDIGFGDVVIPEPQIEALPTQLDQEPPRLYCYSKESAIAEKLEAMIKLDLLNSRMKDFFDVWLLSRQFPFQGDLLAKALDQTLKNRGTKCPMDFVIFKKEFLQEKKILWSAFRKRMNLEILPMDLSLVLKDLEVFLTPLLQSISLNHSPPGQWLPNTGWS